MYENFQEIWQYHIGEDNWHTQSKVCGKLKQPSEGEKKVPADIC